MEMPIKNVTTLVTGLAGVTPRIIYIDTSDTFATVTTAGYLNSYVTQLMKQQLSLSSEDTALVHTTDERNQWLNVTITGVSPNFIYSLTVPIAAGGGIFAGNVQAGSNGIAGSLISFPATALSGSLTVSATASPGNFTGLITNAALLQNTTFTIPDPGVAATNFVLTNSAGTQTIATGNLALSLGTLTLGSAGHASSLTLFPATAANGTFIIAPVNAGGAFNTTFSNGVMGQSTAFTLPDPGNALARVLVAASATPFVTNHSIVASGTGGLVADAGYQMKTVAQAVVAGGAAAQTVVDAFCTAGSCVVACWNDTTNAVTIQKVAAGVGSFVVTSSADPGASHISYIITKV
jgi:hypothetical protein